MQHTLKRTVSLIGTGLHSGRAVRMALHPAGIDAGISFSRTDIRQRNAHVRALWNTVNDTGLCTRIANEDGVEVSTIEHLMAAFAGLGLSNVRVELDGPEVPIMDGSARRFVAEILAAGLVAQQAPARVMQVMQTVRVEQQRLGRAFAGRIFRNRLRDRICGHDHRPSGAQVRHAERHFCARTGRLPHLLPPSGC